jgi:dihydropteroate synthase
MTKRTLHAWKCRDRVLELGRKTRIMAILNATPDSFSDGGTYHSPEEAVQAGLNMLAQGADIIDVGGESTRPGAQSVSVEEELARVIPVIQQLRRQTDRFISVDTMKAPVAEAALEAGADIINDVSAFQNDPALFEVAARYGAGVVLMHMQGTPQTMQNSPCYTGLIQDIATYLAQRLSLCEQAGISRQQIVIDPGIGFGKTLQHNLEILRNIPAFAANGPPVLIGASRKRFLGTLLGRENPRDRLAGNLGAAAWSILHGAHILRVHDVIDTCDMCTLMDTLLEGENVCI